MPINLSALQFDVSWKKYHQIEQQKVEKEEQKTITETVKSKTYHLTSDTAEFLTNPTSLKLQLTGDDKLNALNDDVFQKLELVFKVGSTEYATFTGSQVKGVKIEEKNSLSEATIDLSAYALPDGQYDVSIRSTSELTANNPPIEVKMAFHKSENYTAAMSQLPKNGQVVTFYYPSADGKTLIPYSETLSNTKILRNIVNRLYTGAPETLPVMKGQIIPRIYNIQLKSGVLSLYIADSEAKKYMTTHTSGKLAIESLVRTLYSLDYVKTIELYVNKQKTGLAFNDVTLEALPQKNSVSQAYLSYQLPDTRLILIPSENVSLGTDPQSLFSVLKSGEALANGILLQAVVPNNVSLNSATPLEKTLTLDLKVDGDLYGQSTPLTQRMLDALTLTYLKHSAYDTLVITINGQPVTTLNGIDMTQPLKLPMFINPIQ